MTTKDEHVREELAAANRHHAFTPFPMEARHTKGPPHDQGGLHHRLMVPVKAPHHRGSQRSRTEEAMRLLPENQRQHTPRTKAPHQGTPPQPPKTHTASPPRGLPDLPANRSKERLHPRGEGYNNHHTSHHDDHQPPYLTDHRRRYGKPEARDHAPDPVGRRHRSDLATASEQHRPDPRPTPIPAPPNPDAASPRLHVTLTSHRYESRMSPSARGQPHADHQEPTMPLRAEPTTERRQEPTAQVLRPQPGTPYVGAPSPPLSRAGRCQDLTAREATTLPPETHHSRV
jgi:hypothetical protein